MECLPRAAPLAAVTRSVELVAADPERLERNHLPVASRNVGVRAPFMGYDSRHVEQANVLEWPDLEVGGWLTSSRPEEPRPNPDCRTADDVADVESVTTEVGAVDGAVQYSTGNFQVFVVES
jgi:hypothetical protein